MGFNMKLGEKRKSMKWKGATEGYRGEDLFTNSSRTKKRSMLDKKNEWEEGWK